MQKITLELWVRDTPAGNDIIDWLNGDVLIPAQEDRRIIVADEDAPEGTGWRFTWPEGGE